MRKKTTFRAMFPVFMACALLCLANCSNDDAPLPAFTPEALQQTTYPHGYDLERIFRELQKEKK